MRAPRKNGLPLFAIFLYILNIKRIFIFIAASLACCAGYAKCKSGAELDGAKKSLYAGCDRSDFIFEGKKCVLVVPRKPRGYGAWILRPAFFGAFDAADKELLKRGFYLAHCDVSNRYASPQSRREMDRFYEFMVSKRGLSRKVAVEGLSRGGAPVLMIVGDSDDIVPFIRRGKIYQDRFFDNGGAMTLIIRQGGGHHPHGLANPAPIVDFMERALNDDSDGWGCDSRGDRRAIGVEGVVMQALRENPQSKGNACQIIGFGVNSER